MRETSGPVAWEDGSRVVSAKHCWLTLEDPMDLSEYFTPIRPVAASPATIHPEVAQLVLARHQDNQKPVTWEKVQEQLGL